MEEQKSKFKGWRKLGIAGAAISGLLLKPPTDIRIAIIVGIVAVIGILVQGFLDWKAAGKNETG